MAKALHEINHVVALVIEDLRESGEPIPEPQSRRRFSGRLNLRMPPSLHRRLSSEAARENVSLNQLIMTKLSAVDSA